MVMVVSECFRSEIGFGTYKPVVDTLSKCSTGIHMAEWSGIYERGISKRRVCQHFENVPRSRTHS